MTEHETESDVLGDLGTKVLRAAADAESDGTCDPLAVAVNAMILEHKAQAWDEGYRQSMLAHGHIPEGSDPLAYGPPSRGPHANPYRPTRPGSEGGA